MQVDEVAVRSREPGLADGESGLGGGEEPVGPGDERWSVAVGERGTRLAVQVVAGGLDGLFDDGSFVDRQAALEPPALVVGAHRD